VLPEQGLGAGLGSFHVDEREGRSQKYFADSRPQGCGRIAEGATACKT
jgi:hypothetical protein